MCRHVIGAFHIMKIGWITVRRPSLHKRFKIGPYIRIRIFGYQEGCTGMPQKKLTQAILYLALTDAATDFGSNVLESPARGSNFKIC
mgnify:CR=1 FL=1